MQYHIFQFFLDHWRPAIRKIDDREAAITRANDLATDQAPTQVQNDHGQVLWQSNRDQ